MEGKCIHCGRRLSIALDGDSQSGATLEHILPRHHGGDDDIENLAVACARCNSTKGCRLDHRRLDDATLQAVIERLRARRAERWREPLQEIELPIIHR